MPTIGAGTFGVGPIASRLGVALAVLMQAHAAVAGISFVGGDLIEVAPRPEYMLAGDLTGDGRTDIVVVSPASREVAVFVASPDAVAHLVPAQTLHLGTGLRSPALGDLDADGRLDLAVADASAKSVWVLLGKGDGSFLEPYAIGVPTALHPSAVAIGNFDDTGSFDLAVADARRGRVFILRNDNGTPPCFVPGGDFAVGPQPTQIDTADFNGDGQPDLVTLNLGGSPVRDVSIALWQRLREGVAEFEVSPAYMVGEHPGQMTIADFNGDERPDLALLNSDSEGDSGEIIALLNQGSGGFLPRMITPVGCPFFTGGAPCRLFTLAAGDFDGNGRVDLVVGLSDPRRFRDLPVGAYDAMQVFAGAGDGRFVPGPVVAIQKAPLSMVTGIISGSGKLDLAVVGERTLSLQAFVNTSTPGYQLNGNPCLLGDECLSSHCVNGVCCAAFCYPERNEVCNIIGREGTCQPIPWLPTECALPDGLACGDDRPVCVDGWCCDDECIGGRCDVDGAIGLCIPGLPDGQTCGDDDECASGFCGANFVCCREACDGGFCDGVGVCHPALPHGSPCQGDVECQSNVCDVFDGMCCNRRCDPAVEGCRNGICARIDSVSSTAAALLPTTPPASNPCGSCPSGTTRVDNLCVASGGSGGCATVDGISTSSIPAAMAWLPVALWIRRRWPRGRARGAHFRPAANRVIS